MAKSFELDDRKMQIFIKALKKKLPEVRIGVLDDKDHRKDGSTNAKIGMKHEFGMDGMPVRSFLRVPLTNQMQKYLDRSDLFQGAGAKQMVDAVFQQKTLIPLMEQIGIVGEQIVQDGFASSGFGMWPPSNMAHKKVHMTLVETQQLRNSIGSTVTGGTE